MASVDTHRVSQRQVKACKECTRRKIRCDRNDPCSRCGQKSIPCTREIVRISKAETTHREELGFLRGLVSVLRETRDLDYALSSLDERIFSLQHGTPAPRDAALPSSTTGQPVHSPHSGGPSPASHSPSASPYPPPLSIPGTSLPAMQSEPQIENIPPNEGLLQPAPESDNGKVQASKVRTIEFLAWGRHAGRCFPHRSCQCRSLRSYSEMVSINADPGWAGIRKVHMTFPPFPQLSSEEAKALVMFHFEHLLWHHNVFHAPTFLAQCEEFWTTDTVDHPLWMALYLSVLAVSSWTILNLEQPVAFMSMNEATVNGLFRSMVSTLYEHDFLDNLSAPVYSIQAITLSTRVSHNLGLSELNATLLGAAIRIAHCLGLHQISRGGKRHMTIETEEDWYCAIETEVGRRCWLQLIIQDYFQIPFTETYMIQSTHYSTQLPRNCHDEDMEDQDDNVPTINSYTRTLSRIASLMPPLFDRLGGAQPSLSPDQICQHVVRSESDFRALIKDIPKFFLREQSEASNTGTQPSWFSMARRSLAISAADKLIMIHRPMIFHSFMDARFSRTRRICVSAAMTILKEHEAISNENTSSLWTHSAFCVTAAMVLGLELLFRDVHVDDDATKLRVALKQAACRLRIRKCDVIAGRGAALIDAFIGIEEQLVVHVMRCQLQGSSVRAYQAELVNEILEKNEILARFLSHAHHNPVSLPDLSCTPLTSANTLPPIQNIYPQEHSQMGDLLDSELWFDQILF